ncbi:MAG: hypothetical protein JSV89_18730 [Spirochaetaceae bacterium]|nr:MAG: hypothetical protein JSV89_18730 [Spirochaetaceae bacterium]
MDIVIFTRSRKLPERLKFRKRKGLIDEVSYLRPEQFAPRLKAVDSPTLCYLDTSAIEEGKLTGYLRNLRAKANILYGIIDPNGKIKDVAQLFHQGAVDYLDRRALESGVGMSRLKTILDYVQSIHPTLLAQAAVSTRERRRAPYILSGSDWTSVETGREYTFSMMYIELDGKDQMEKNYGQQNLSIALASFRKFIEGFVKKFSGRLWMWFGFGGIVLFPFDAKSCPALTCGFRLLLFKHLYDVEGSHFPNFLSFRLVLQIGNTPYSEENTGHIVSDSLNSIFHLGQQFVRPGNFCVTDEVMQFGHSALRDYFVAAGTFEGRKILRMRLPVHRYIRN